ncbi:hypothetical protein QQP08_010898 [Theobroma cacao]|nr:hypothetical protein QQP08_010898 [Theobroma cacao]
MFASAGLSLRITLKPIIGKTPEDQNEWSCPTLTNPSPLHCHQVNLVSVSLSLLLNNCGKKIPSGFQQLNTM